MSNKIYRNVTTRRIFDWLPFVRYSVFLFGHRKSIQVRKGEEAAIKKLYPNSRKFSNQSDDLVHLDEIHKEIYETGKKWQSRRTPIICNKIEVPIEYHFSKAMGVYVNPLPKT